MNFGDAKIKFELLDSNGVSVMSQELPVEVTSAYLKPSHNRDILFAHRWDGIPSESFTFEEKKGITVYPILPETEVLREQ